MNVDFSLLDNVDNSPPKSPLPPLPPQQPDPAGENAAPESQFVADQLLVLHTRKVELLQQVESLQTRKAELLDATARLRATLDDYHRQHRHYETREKLEYYLHQNDYEYSRLSAPDAAAGFVLENVNVLPSSDWPLRLALAREFYPHMEVGDLTSSQVHENDTLVSVMAWSVAAKGVPALQIKLYVRDESVVRLEVANWASVDWLLRKLSPTFHRTLKQNYLPRGKADLLMYGYHALARLQSRRISALSNVLTAYKDLVSRPSHDWSQDAYASLAGLPYIELDLRPKGKSFSVRLSWNLCLNDPITALVESEIEFAIIGDQTAVIDNANSVFLSLVPQHGVEKAFDVMLSNIFGVQKD